MGRDSANRQSKPAEGKSHGYARPLRAKILLFIQKSLVVIHYKLRLKLLGYLNGNAGKYQ